MTVSDSQPVSAQPAPVRFPGAERLPVIGIVGGVASGKSFVAEQLERLGAVRLDADRAAHTVLAWPEVVEEIRRRWGSGVIDDEGRVNRKALADIVFAPSAEGREQRAALEAITHPRIAQQIAGQARRAAADPAVKALVLDAPVMIEAGWDALCQHLLFVDAPREVRLERARQRGWSDADFAAREAAQESLENKRARADFVIDNGGDPEYTRAQIERFWKQHFPQDPT